MNALRWILLALYVVLLVGWAVAYFRGRRHLGRGWKLLGALLIVVLLQRLADFYPDTPVGWTLLVLSCFGLVWCLFVGIGEARATWREQMERVKHL